MNTVQEFQVRARASFEAIGCGYSQRGREFLAR